MIHVLHISVTEGIHHYIDWVKEFNAYYCQSSVVTVSVHQKVSPYQQYTVKTVQTGRGAPHPILLVDIDGLLLQ